MYSFSCAAKTIGFSIDRLYEKEIEDNEWPYGHSDRALQGALFKGNSCRTRRDLKGCNSLLDAEMKNVCAAAKDSTHEVVDRTKKDAKSVTFYSVEILQPLRWVITFAAENAGADLGIPHRKNQYAITYNGSIFFNALSYDRNPQPSTSLSLVSCPGHLALSSRTSWHRASSCLPESFQKTGR
jgi:hypothetical protein